MSGGSPASLPLAGDNVAKKTADEEGCGDAGSSGCSSIKSSGDASSTVGLNHLDDQVCPRLFGYTNAAVIDDIEDGTSSVLSNSYEEDGFEDDECLAFRAPWATPPTATIESHKQLTKHNSKQLEEELLSDCITSPPLSLDSEFVVCDLGDTFPPLQKTSLEEETTSTVSYMEQLLRDGGDLDSMDRSLLDYGGSKGGLINPVAAHSNGQDQLNDVNAVKATSVVLSPATPPVTPITSPVQQQQPVIKRDLVVRFTEQQNSVHHVMAAKGLNHSGDKHSKSKPKRRHSEETTSDSETASCNSAQDNQENQGEHPDDDQLLKTPGDGASTNLFLYNDDIGDRPRMASAISTLANYSATIQSGPSDPDAKPVEKANLGTLMGVYLPCIQNIFGVILFIRMTWIVGTAGAIEGFFVVFMACCVTMLTAISMAAIATNGVVPGGGSYFMISRALGPEFGGAVGILFYLATTVAGAMYIIGAVEILMTYLVGPPMSLFGPDISLEWTKFNNFRVYGTILLLIMGTIVFFGVKFVNKFAAVALACVLLTILSIYIGIAVNINGNDKANFCTVGTRIVKKVSNCTKDAGSDLFLKFCSPNETVYGKGPFNDTSGFTREDYVCDPYFEKNPALMRRGIRGLASSAFYENVFQKYRDGGDAISNSTEEAEYNLGGLPKKGFITTDIYTSFVLLVGIFFPSCTGIMAGSNRSGDLADPQKSIPIGTILAIITTSTVYLSSVLLFAGSVDPLLLRDKFGESIGGSLVVGNIAWPHPKVVEVGSLLSTIGAGLQSLTGAPRLLQAISKDGIIPFLKPFQVQSAKGEPVRALGVTICICEIAVLIGNVDEIAPLLSMFFLMCYGFVNLACALQTLLRTPNWRPRFKYYHWSLSLLGVIMCIAVMFMSSWYYALLAMGIAGIIYKYIEYRGAEKEWGDGLRGLALSAARFSLLRLEEGPPHTKNWRPQILILSKLDDKLNVKHKRMFSLAQQLKAGKGLTIAFTALEGSFSKMYGESQAARFSIRQALKDEGVKGFADVVVSKHVTDGICHVIQSAGLGGMKPNTVILGWPNNWRKREEDSWRVFVDTIRNTAAAKMALLVPKGVQRYPDSGDKVKGNIDIWWIVHDGGLLMLLPFLLKQHRTWKNCKLRIFSVAQPEDNSIQMKKDLKTFLYHLRIEADVEVVEMHDSDISEYTYERTLLMEQRNEILKEMKVSEKRRGKMTRRLSLQKHDTFKVVDDMIIQTDKNASDLDVEKILNRHVETVMENSRGEAAAIAEEEPKDASTSAKTKQTPEGSNSLAVPHSKRESSNVRRMHTAVRLNEAIVNRSHEAKLVILNLPSPPKTIGPDRDSSYMEFLEVLTEGLERCLMVRGGGREVITIYS